MEKSPELKIFSQETLEFVTGVRNTFNYREVGQYARQHKDC